MARATQFETHEVFNQSPVFENINLFTSDSALMEAVDREGADWAKGGLSALGGRAGSAATQEQCRLANENPPQLRLFDTRGRRVDVVDFHPAYHHMMAVSTGAGLHCGSWDHLVDDSAPKPGATVARAAGLFMMCQAEPGHFCPISMTHAVVPSLILQPEIAEEWLPRLTRRDYDPSFRPAPEKTAVTIGMGLTEKQGGTDLRTNTTTAAPVNGGGPGADYALTGHKWFLSAPMCDAFLVLAQAPGGLSCFLVPRFLPDGTINAIRLQRLKHKIGNQSNASSECEFEGAIGQLIGEEGRGVRNILEMGTYTRFDCALSSAGLIRQALARAVHHAQHRIVFQKKLADQPMMLRVLADLAVESEAATALVMRLGRAYDAARPGGDPDALETAWKRVMTPVVKYWVCKSAPGFVYEAIECLGGNGYVEENMMGLLYREVPVNSIWEGSGNVMCLDLLRVLAREQDAFEVLFADFEDAGRGSRHLAGAIAALKEGLSDPATLEARARHTVELMARVGAASVLVRTGNEAVADAFCATRFDGDTSRFYGAHEKTVQEAAILERALSVA